MLCADNKLFNYIDKISKVKENDLSVYCDVAICQDVIGSGHILFSAFLNEVNQIRRLYR